MPERPKLNGVVETALYVDDLERARAFYEDVLGLSPILELHAMRAYGVGGHDVLLLFQRGSAAHLQRAPGGEIPPHDGHGPLHMAFAIAEADLAGWEAWLERCGVAVEGRMTWPKGGHSLFFRDPDGHLLEVITPGNWAVY